MKDLVVRHPLIPHKNHIPTLIYNEVTSSYGTGINAVIPGHDIDSLKVASVTNTVSFHEMHFRSIT